jgi:hypothetical protein
MSVETTAIEGTKQAAISSHPRQIHRKPIERIKAEQGGYEQTS